MTLPPALPAALVVWGLLALGCGHKAPGPGAALDAFGAALEREDWAAAHALMSEAYRKRVPLDEFRKQMEAAASEGREAGRALRQNADRFGARVEVAVGGDERVTLVWEQDSWRLEQPPFEPFGQQTPRVALRKFVRALETRRFDVLLDLVPARYQADISAEKLRRFWDDQGAERARALLQALRLALDGPIIEEGDEAFLIYGSGRQVRFVREDGLWRIESPE
jgi:hypothetical protein